MKNRKKYVLIFISVATCMLIIRYFADIMESLGAFIHILDPVITGVVIAYILNIPMRFYEKHLFVKSEKKIVKILKRPVCMIFALLSLLIILAGILMLIVPELISAFTLIGEEIQPMLTDIYNWSVKNVDEMPAIQKLLSNINLDVPSILKQLTTSIVPATGSIFTSVISAVTYICGSFVNFFIGLILAFYILGTKERLRNQIVRTFRAVVHTEKENVLRHIVTTLDYSFSRFIVGQCTEAVILGVLCIIGMAILRFPYALMTGVVVGVTALIPIIGAYIGAAVGAFMIFTVSPIDTLWFILFLVLLQQFEGNVIYPKVVGNSVGLPGLWVLIAVIIGGGIFGVLGMLIGVPLAAACYKLLKEYVSKKEQNDEMDQITFEE